MSKLIVPTVKPEVWGVNAYDPAPQLPLHWFVHLRTTTKKVSHHSWMSAKRAQTNTTKTRVWGYMHLVACSLANRPGLQWHRTVAWQPLGDWGCSVNAPEDITLAVLCAGDKGKELD